MGEKPVGAFLSAPALQRKIHTTMKQQRKKDAKSIRIDRTGLSVYSHAPKLQEKKVENFLSSNLDDQWTLINGYKNAKGEIDQILVSSRGVFAIEIKYSNGTIFCDGDRWWRDKYDQYGNLVETNKPIADKRGRSPSRQVNESSDLLQSFLQKRYPSLRVYRSIIWAHDRSKLGAVNNLNVDYTAVVNDWDLGRFLRNSTYQLSQDEQQRIVESIRKDHTYYNQPRR